MYVTFAMLLENRMIESFPKASDSLLTLPGHLSSLLVFSWVRITRSLVMCMFCLSFCTFSFGHCVVCSSIYEFWLPLWYAQSCTHKASLSPPRFIKGLVSSQVSIRSSICVLWVSSLPMFLRYSDYIVELFFVFHVNTHY